ncbi:hypothetical protein [Allofustis seminis]|uniref:hypothetical protein n=1 Tax=Allofustis seminis TaxID=166939 RepID=UPI00036D7B41|nr:hypothetical protein [Allofustis seminis]
MKEIERELIEKEKQKDEALEMLDALNHDIFKVYKLLDQLDIEISNLKERMAAK